MYSENINKGPISEPWGNPHEDRIIIIIII